MASAVDSAASLDIQIHPLVVMSIADHYTRDIALKAKSKKRVIGALAGQQNGRDVNVLESFEIAFNIDKNGHVDFDKKTFQADLDLFKEAYPTYEMLGWYSTGAKVDPYDLEIHKMMTTYNERPLYLLLNPNPADDTRDIPISVYETEVRVVNKDKTVTEFAKTSFKVTADEAERITVVHCAKVVGTDDSSGSAVTSHYTTLGKAISQLSQRVHLLRAYLQDVASSSEPANQDILRQIKGLTKRLPTMESSEFKEEFLNEYNDAVLTTYLATITQGLNSINDVVDKFNITVGRNQQQGPIYM